MNELLDPDEALARVLRHSPRGAAEERTLNDAVSAVLAEPIRSDRDYPPFDRAMMDGYCVHAVDAGHEVRIVREIVPGVEPEPLARGEAAAIMTGAVCPTDTVIPVERAIVDGDRLTVPVDLRPGAHVSKRGSDTTANRVVLEAGHVLSPLGIGVLATFGASRVKVVRRARVAVCVTGDELRPGGGPTRVRDANGPLLAAFVDACGAELVSLEHAVDSLDALTSRIEALQRVVDVVVLTGGVSAGRYDWVPSAVAGAGGTIVFRGVAQRPGKPLLFAQHGSTSIFGLPGNPLSCATTFHAYVGPALRHRMGKPVAPLTSRGVLETPLHAASMLQFVFARALPNGAELTLRPLVHGTSADLFGPATANGMIRVPKGVSPAVGDKVAFEWLS